VSLALEIIAPVKDSRSTCYMGKIGEAK